MYCCQIDFSLQQYRRKQKASFHKALWEINEMSWPPYLCCYHFVCVSVRARVMDVITLKLDKSAQLLFTRMVCWPQSGSPCGVLFNTILQ